MEKPKVKIIVNRISYKNFKGFDDFELELNGKSAIVKGSNGSGKTSLSDGLQWLLFGKDSFGNKLNPKPIDKDNNEMLGLAPIIEAELIINDKVVLMKRVQEEKWTAKRGELEKTRSSDTTKYYIDNVPFKEKEWKQFIENIASEELLQMFSNVEAFMRIDWKKRREILISLSGLSDEEIINNDEELKELSQYLEEHTVDEMRKILAGQKKEFKKDIEGISARIQENKDAVDRANISDVNQEDLQKQLVEAEKVLLEKEDQLAMVKTSDASIGLREKLSELNMKLSDKKSSFLAGINLAIGNLQKDVSAEQVKVSKQKEIVNSLSFEIVKLENELANLSSQRKTLLEEYHTVKNLKFDEHRQECVMCGQTLPEDQVEKLMAEFNEKRANNLEEKLTKGKEIKAKIEVVEQEVNNKKVLLEQANTDLQRLEENYSILEKDYQEQSSNYGTFENTSDYKSIQEEIGKVNAAIEGAKNNVNSTIVTAQAEYDDAKLRVNQLTSSLAAFKYVDEFNNRIAELRQKDAELKQANMEVERKLFLLDEFTRRKVKMLEASINNKFELVNFKLFEIQKNGGLNELCEATFEGVEYSSGLSTGERALCDLDILKGLQKGLGIELPVFLDNAESITKAYQYDGQIIKLFAEDVLFTYEVI